MVSTIWGEFFETIGCEIMHLKEGVYAGKSIKDAGEEKGCIVTMREIKSSTNFELESSFNITFEDGSNSTFYLDEKVLFGAFFKNEEFFKKVGRESCVLLDFCWSLGGSEAIAETFFGMMSNQRKDGGQLNKTLEARTIIDYCMPHPSNSPKMI